MNRLLLLSLVLVLMPLAACEDEECTTCPPPATAPEPTLANAWPNDDGRQWTYDFFSRGWSDSTISSAEALTVDDVDSLLAIAAPLEANTEAHIWRQVFEGITTTDSGATGQLLRGYYYEDVEGGVQRWRPADRKAWLERLVPPRRLTKSEFNARRICCVGGLFIEGGPAFVKTDELIGSYGDIDLDLSWKYLEANIEPGHRFSMQLVPSLADDVYLYAEVREVHDLQTPYGTFENVLSVNYLVDQGEQTAIDEGGSELGTFHSYHVARMEYVPEVGPVYVVERSILPGPDGVDGPFVFEYEYWMIGTKGREAR